MTQDMATPDVATVATRTRPDMATAADTDMATGGRPEVDTTTPQWVSVATPWTVATDALAVVALAAFVAMIMTAVATGTHSTGVVLARAVVIFAGPIAGAAVLVRSALARRARGTETTEDGNRNP